MQVDNEKIEDKSMVSTPPTKVPIAKVRIILIKLCISFTSFFISLQRTEKIRLETS